jgi:hypothetical protein
LTGIQLPAEEQEVEARSLYQVLQEVTDGRKKRGRRYEAAVVLTIIVLAKMAGEKGLSGIAHWARLRLDWLRQRLPLKRATLPCANTYQYICDHMALDELNEKLGTYFAAVPVRTPSQAGNVGILLGIVMAAAGGVMTDVPTKGNPLYWRSRFAPHAHAIEGYFKLMVGGGVTDVLPQIGLLAGVGVLFLVIAAWRFRLE